LKRPCVSASPFAPDAIRDPSPEGIVSDLTALQGTLKAMTSTVNSYKGGVVAAAPINKASKAVNVAVARLDDDAENIKFTDDDSAQKVLDAVIAAEPFIQETLDSVVAKKGTFSTALKPKVSTSLDKLVVNTLSLGKKLEGNVPADFAPKVKAETDKLEESFKKAKADFASK
jgi:hypothetical protein